MSYIKHKLRSYYRDLINYCYYGPQSPVYAEHIWLGPKSCNIWLERGCFFSFYKRKLRPSSGRIVKDWPIDQIKPIDESEKINYCFRHWVDGLSWKQAGAYDYLLEKISQATNGVYDGCSSLEDIERRYDTIDRLFDHACKYGFRLRKDLFPGNFREVGGVIIHMGPEAIPCFGGAGYHRFAIAKILQIPLPAQMGVVHISALERFADFRQTS